MGKRIKGGLGKLGEVGQSAGSIMTGANLRSSSEKKPPEAEPDDKSDPLSASSPEEAMALAIKFLEGLK